MTTLDWVLAAGLGIGMWRGLRTGALAQAVGTVGWLLGFVVATAIMRPLGEMAATALGVSPRTAPVLGFVVAFGAVVAGLAAAAHVLRRGLQAVKLGGVDRLAGAGVGAVRSAFGLSVLLLVTGFSPIPGSGPILISEETREASVLDDPIEPVAPWAWDLARGLTPGIQEAVADRFNTWRESRDERLDEPGSEV
ncbi:MAG TPA: CvpA family protein [Bacteroidetes bacterium]|nr:CvpA family protein [Bacteroidota bacterium]HIL58219.1 CvpA family protein [Rhodothermales bacterium]